MRIGICDDSVKDTELLTGVIKGWSSRRQIKTLISTFSSAEEFLFHYPDEQQFDLIFIDIQMQKMDGIQLSGRIRERDEQVPLVFITSFPEYALCGYEVAALHYLMKPAPRENVWACLDRAKQQLEKQTDARLHIVSGRANVVLRFDQIFYCIMFDHYIDIHTETETFKSRITIAEFEKQLPSDQFFRCHRSYIVNLNKIQMIVSDTVVLDNQVKIPISKNKIEDFNSAFFSYYK